MSKGRLEAFSDGVIAIIITIMVLELAAPHDADLAALRPLTPIFLSYVLSFVYIGIYWHNHHHLLHLVQRVDGRVLWANSHLLFWLSLVPFGTAWMGENRFAAWPVAIYGIILLCTGVAYIILTRVLIVVNGQESQLAHAVGRNVKGRLSVLILFAAIVLTVVNAWISCALYVLVTITWLVPDRRIEQTLVR